MNEQNHELPGREMVVVIGGPAEAILEAPAGAFNAAQLVEEAGGRLTPLLEQAAQAAPMMESAMPEALARYQVVQNVADSDLDHLRENLSHASGVASVYIKPAPELPSLNQMQPAGPPSGPGTPDYQPQQLYLEPSPAGVDAYHAWTIPGGDGAGVRIIDVEGGWNFDHEDLQQNMQGLLSGQHNAAWENHGTAVIGEMGGDLNQFGVTGISPAASIAAVSIFPARSSSLAIIEAAGQLGPGDILLIELHRAGPRHKFQPRFDQMGYIAIEWWPDDFAAIEFATQNGIIVVEAAGNGAENLDDPIYSQPDQGFPVDWTNPFDRHNRDCGAIIVGAGAPPSGNFGPDRSRLDFSNFGACLDAQGWGQEVVTTGYGDLQGGQNSDLWYTEQFSGTSSASPIVTSTVACMQGVLRHRGSPLLDSLAARYLLHQHGAPQTDGLNGPSSQRIGSRPDLYQLLGVI